MLPANCELANKRFQNLLKRIEKHPKLFATSHQIFQDQRKEGIEETAPQISNKPEHYVPHKSVVREKAESTKVHIMYDASAKKNPKTPSLNECLDIGPSSNNDP